MKNWVSFLLIMLIAVQSVLAVADTHEIYPSDSEHHELDDRNCPDNEADNLPVGEPVDLNRSPISANDCQHCSHLHSPLINLLPSMASSLLLVADKPHLFDRSSFAANSLPASFYRPPRA